MLAVGIGMQIAGDCALMYGCHQFGRVDRYTDHALPLSMALGACAAALVFHVVASLPLAGMLDLSDVSDRMVYVSTTVLSGLGPAIVFARLLLHSASTSAAESLYGLRTAQPLNNDFSKARALFHQKDTDGAVKECWQSFLQEPNNPEALFQAVRFLWEDARAADAAEILREILRRFPKQNNTWVRAAFFLAELYEGSLEERQTATYLFREIAKRSPLSTYGAIARARLEKNREAQMP